LKNKIVRILFLGIILLVASSASADTVTFGDTSITWPGWEVPPNSDLNGTPDFLGGTAEVVNGYLTELNFTLTPTGSTQTYLNLFNGIYFKSVNRLTYPTVYQADYLLWRFDTRP